MSDLGESAAVPTPFEQTVVVGPADLDVQAHVNNVVYVRWVQDVAIAHWESLAPPDARAEVAWAMLRHEIDYLGAAVLGDALTLRTWVGSAERLTFERFVEIRARTMGASWPARARSGVRSTRAPAGRGV